MDTLVELSGVSVSDERSHCPICFKSAPFAKGLENHLAHHLERLAMFALPRPVEDDASTTDKPNSQRMGERSLDSAQSLGPPVFTDHGAPNSAASIDDDSSSRMPPINDIWEPSTRPSPSGPPPRDSYTRQSSPDPNYGTLNQQIPNYGRLSAIQSVADLPVSAPSGPRGRGDRSSGRTSPANGPPMQLDDTFSAPESIRPPTPEHPPSTGPSTSRTRQGLNQISVQPTGDSGGSHQIPADEALEQRRQILDRFKASRRRRRQIGLMMYTLNAASKHEENAQWRKATLLFLLAIKEQSMRLGPDDSLTLSTIEKLARTYVKRDRLIEAGKLWARLVQVGKRKLGDSHPDTLSYMMCLGETYTNQGRWEESESIWKEVIGIQTRILGRDDSDTMMSLSYLAALYGKQGRRAENEALLLEITALREPHRGAMKELLKLASSPMDQRNQEAFGENAKGQSEVPETERP
ncbi:hypothetical protein CHGG_01927 [Chaetomium globosum CBS 148.51]|uniref:Uncharacterized protein n=1 Tax=Chaetomium globosum (strain ATCC 6205 / CBS 148.51 / DSM 1962 / NBRC 6347 / NRRL 1970) TaxID=306901 RepID=Q2HCX7_CHAGB|nr:uncharacterized protein CHGG_01927 [Chaetomium globosum CBS 148.51]EAQ93692.1 hypothetical protein CHGG_01927 [Chaetomium globosum CBS 148.51]